MYVFTNKCVLLCFVLRCSLGQGDNSDENVDRSIKRLLERLEKQEARIDKLTDTIRRQEEELSQYRLQKR